MAKVVQCASFEELRQRLQADLAAKAAALKAAPAKVASKGAPVVRANVPVAFGELRDGTHAAGGQIRTDAPHAAAVEVGSRPHWVPIAPLIAWVKLRGMQGLHMSGPQLAAHGPTTAEHATAVAGHLQGLESGGALSTKAPEQVARAIQAAIAKRGTRPHLFARKSLPQIAEILDTVIRDALKD